MNNANVILNEQLKTLHELLADILVCIEVSWAVSCHCSRVTLSHLVSSPLLFLSWLFAVSMYMCAGMRWGFG